MFVTDEDLKDITADRVNKLLTSVVQKSVEEALKVLPFAVNSLIDQLTSAKTLSVKFYEDNKELQEHKKLVASCIEELESRNPGRPLENILIDVLPMVKERLGKINTIKPPTTNRPNIKDIDFGAL